MASKSSSKVSKEPSKIVKTYLFSYNAIQVVGWSYLLYLVSFYYLYAPRSASLWDIVKTTLIVFQNAAALEIIHAALKLVSSNVIITTFQVFSRIMVVCGVLMATPTGPESPGLGLALIAWSVTEIIRYGFYALNIIKVVPYLLIWLRYTTFIILYPIGVTGELLCLYAAQSYVSSTNMWSLRMPNPLNFTFSYHYFLVFIMLLYIPLFPQLYLHMFAQRRKVLGQSASSSKKSR